MCKQKFIHSLLKHPRYSELKSLKISHHYRRKTEEISWPTWATLDAKGLRTTGLQCLMQDKNCSSHLKSTYKVKDLVDVTGQAQKNRKDFSVKIVHGRSRLVVFCHLGSFTHNVYDQTMQKLTRCHLHTKQNDPFQPKFIGLINKMLMNLINNDKKTR